MIFITHRQALVDMEAKIVSNSAGKM